jgi:hypothetical protein
MRFSLMTMVLVVLILSVGLGANMKAGHYHEFVFGTALLNGEKLVQVRPVITLGYPDK